MFPPNYFIRMPLEHTHAYVIGGRGYKLHVVAIIGEPCKKIKYVLSGHNKQKVYFNSSCNAHFIKPYGNPGVNFRRLKHD